MNAKFPSHVPLKLIYTIHDAKNQRVELRAVITIPIRLPPLTTGHMLHKKSSPLLVCGLLAMSSVSRGDLVISGVLDATLSGGVPKLVELYAVREIADLSVYLLEQYNNGGNVSGTVSFSGSATAGAFLYAVSRTTEQSELDTWFGPGFITLGASNVFAGGININGDDALRLAINGTDADHFGVIGTDGTGEPWEYRDGWAYRIRGTGPDPGGFVLSHWGFSGADALDGVGSNAAAGPTAFPLESFASSSTPEPASLAMMGLGAAGLFAAAVRRRRRKSKPVAGACD